MYRKLFFALTILLYCGLSSAQVRIDSSFAFATNPAKKYSLYIPSSYNASSANEMMVGFHPFNTSRWDAESWCDTLLAFSEMNDLILVCPDGDADGNITDSIDYAFTTILIDSVRKWYNIDDNRIYAIGFSMGGKAVYEYGLNNHERFAGFVPIGAAINGTTFVSDVLPNAAWKPFYVVHGANDLTSQRFFPIVGALHANCALVDSNLMPGVGHTIDFLNRNQILTAAYNWVDSMNNVSYSGSFDLLSPANFASITLRGFTDYPHHFTWEQSSIADTCGAMKYEALTDAPGGSFNPPAFRRYSDNAGADTVLTMTNAQLDSLLIAQSIPINGTLAFDWTVQSDILGIHRDTAKSFNIQITRKRIGFDVLKPVNNNVILLNNGSAKFFEWQSLNHYISIDYNLQFDDTTGDFSQPVASFVSSNLGKNPSLSIQHSQLYYDILFPIHTEKGDSVHLIWNAIASDTIMSEMTATHRNVVLIMGDVGFNLIAPLNNSLLTSKKDVSYEIYWDSVPVQGVKYEWRFDTLGVVIDSVASIVLPSENNGDFSRLFLDFEDMDSIMNFYNVDYLDTLHGQWTCHVLDDTIAEKPLNGPYKVSIVRAHPVGLSELEEEDALLIFPNPASQEVIINSSKELIRAELFDLNGKKAGEFVLNPRDQQHKIMVNDLAEGHYQLRVYGKNYVGSKSILIQRNGK